MRLNVSIEREYYLKRRNVKFLYNYVLHAWNNCSLDLSIKKVLNRIRLVLCNILEGGVGWGGVGWGYALVEAKRGAKLKDIKIEKILTELKGDERSPEINYMVGGKEEDNVQ